MRSKLATIVIYIASVAALAMAAQAQAEKFNPNGGMFIVSGDTKVPRTLNSFVGFAIITENYRKNGRAYSIKPSGVVYETGDHTLNLRNIGFNGLDLSFDSAVVRGIRYEFFGTIVKSAEKDSNGNDIVLTGHLTKFLRGKKVAEVDAKFTFEEGD